MKKILGYITRFISSPKVFTQEIFEGVFEKIERNWVVEKKDV